MSIATGSGPNRRSFLLGAGAALTGMALAGCSGGMVRQQRDPYATHTPPPAPTESTSTSTTFVVYGDSLTAGHRRRLDYGLPPIDTWLRYVGGDLVWSGGAAISGATAELLSGMLTTTAKADYGIYFFGTNDRRHRRSVDEMVSDITAAHESIPESRRPTHPCLVAVGPQGSASLSSAVDIWNVKVKLRAEDLGWGYLDPWGQLRASSALGGAGQWSSAGVHRDLLHPNPDGARLLGAGMKGALEELDHKK